MYVLLFTIVGALLLAGLCTKWSLPLSTSLRLIGITSVISTLAGLSLLRAEGLLISGFTLLTLQVGSFVSIVLWRFYRDPERTSPKVEDSILSPADGRVIYIRQVDEDVIPESHKLGRPMLLAELSQSSLAKRRVWHIGISMVFTDVHVNRSPIDGKVTLLHHRPGKFLSLRHQDALGVNERQTIVIENERVQLAIIQIASRLVRRIEAYIREGDAVALGQRIGVIKLGSQVDLIIPEAAVAAIDVKLGQSLIAGQTVVCRLTSARSR
jgi:phosphatidylserine decarboxylase